MRKCIWLVCLLLMTWTWQELEIRKGVCLLLVIDSMGRSVKPLACVLIATWLNKTKTSRPDPEEIIYYYQLPFNFSLWLHLLHVSESATSQMVRCVMALLCVWVSRCRCQWFAGGKRTTGCVAEQGSERGEKDGMSWRGAGIENMDVSANGQKSALRLGRSRVRLHSLNA